MPLAIPSYLHCLLGICNSYLNEKWLVIPPSFGEERFTYELTAKRGDVLVKFFAVHVISVTDRYI